MVRLQPCMSMFALCPGSGEESALDAGAVVLGVEVARLALPRLAEYFFLISFFLPQ